MTLAGFSIRRPVLTIVLSLLILLAGGIGLGTLPVREFPDVDPPSVTITTAYPGAAAEIIQAQITEPIEEAVNAVAGIVSLTSSSREGASIINAEFALGTDLETAASDVRDRLARVVRSLPVDANPPVIDKANADSSPILGLVLTSDRRSQLELGAVADALRERLQTVPGVASVDQPAEKRYAMRLWLDPDRLAAHGVSPLDVRLALARENVELPSGRIDGTTVEMPVKMLTRLGSVAEFNDLILRREADRIVRLSDVGYAELGAQNERSALKVDGRPVAGLNFRQQPGSNQIEVVDQLRRRIAQVSADLPPDVRLQVAFDNTSYVRQSLLEVAEAVLASLLLVVLVVFAFLREWRTTLIPILAIPVSIVGAFAVMALCDLSINTLTLLGIVLAVGLVVDDAIVVLENIHAKMEGGLEAAVAAEEGTREILVAVLATTVTLVVVFLPLLFIGGLSGRLFREFGITIAGAVLISAVVALTLTPMLASRLLVKQGEHGWLFRRTEPFFAAMEASYAASLRRLLPRRLWALPVIVAAGALIVLIYGALPRELVPLEDRGRMWVRASAPEGTSYEAMQRFMDELTTAVRSRVPEAELTLTQVPGASGSRGTVAGSSNTAYVRVFLKDPPQRERSQQQIAADLRAIQKQFTGARINVTQEETIGERRASQTGIQFVIQAPDMGTLREVLPGFLERARRDPAIAFADADLKFSKPELQVRLEREKAQMLGVSTQDVAQTLQAALSGQRISYFVYEGRQYEVIAQLTRGFRAQPSDVGDISLRTGSGTQVPLANVVSLQESVTVPDLYRYNRYSAATVSATTAPGYTVGDGVAALQRTAGEVLDDRFSTALTGTARDFVESSGALGGIFMLALALIYLVLAAQFESFRSPLVILVTVPLALAGALLALWYFGQSLNLFSQIGLVMLIGLITKNGILIVEFANQRHEAGAPSRLEAVHGAAVARLRPILMTTLATILGILPVALALGAGSESRMSMGIAVIGGLAFGSALTLYVIPAVYVLASAERVVRGDVKGDATLSSDAKG